MKIEIFKIKKHFRKGGLHTNPDIFWNILQITALLLVISSFVLGFYLFNKTNKGFTASNENPDGQIKSISKERIDKTLEYFSEKSKKSNEILNSAAPVVDPSR